MANNYQSRIELIVDDIAKDNVEFKAKTIAQQSAQKTDMILSISKSIAGLNDVGQNLVLSDIEKEVRENRIDIIDSSGNINVTELTRFTSTLVKAKIDEFERQGINLRLDSQITRDSKISVTETVLSVAVINDMISNYDNLSQKDIGILISNYSSMTSAQQDAFNQKQAESLMDLASKTDNAKVQRAFKRTAGDIRRMRDKNDKAKYSFDKATPEEQASMIFSTVSSLKSLYNTILTGEKSFGLTSSFVDDLESLPKDLQTLLVSFQSFEDVSSFSKEYSENPEKYNKLYSKLLDMKAKLCHVGVNNQKAVQDIIQISPSTNNIFNQDEAFSYQIKLANEISNAINLNSPELHKDKDDEYLKPVDSQSAGYQSYKQSSATTDYTQQNKKVLKNSNSVDSQTSNEEILSQVKLHKGKDDEYLKPVDSQLAEYQSYKLSSVTADYTQQQSQEQQLQEEIRQIPSELAKANYSQEQITDALKKYKTLLEQLPEKYILKFKNEEEIIVRQNTLSSLFIKKFNMPQEMSNILSKVDYNGKLFEILGDEEQRKTFFEQLDIVIENPNRQKPVSDPEYDKKVAEQGREVDLDASAAEALKEQRGTSERTSNMQKEPQEETPTDTTGQADSSTAEHKPQDEVETPHVQGTESSQNMALVQQDNSFLGKIKRTMSKIKSSIKAKVSKFLSKEDKSTIEEDKTTSSEQVEAETTVPELHNTLDRYNYRDNDLEKNALNNFNQSRNTTREQSERSDTEPGD